MFGDHFFGFHFGGFERTHEWNGRIKGGILMVMELKSLWEVGTAWKDYLPVFLKTIHVYFRNCN